MRTSFIAIVLGAIILGVSSPRTTAAEDAAGDLKQPGTTQSHNRFEDAGDYGFSPTASAADNVAALQKAITGGNKTLTVSRPGEYLLNNTIYLDDDTTILFGQGVLLKKTGQFAFVFINRGALTKTWNKNITLDGLHLSVNRVDNLPSSDQNLFGLRGHVTMYYVRNFTLSHFQCLDCAKAQYAVHFCRFNNLTVDTFQIKGDKDGVHIGTGEKFVIRNGICETFDDAVALNAEDYPSSQPEQGDIKDGLVENIYDIKKSSTSGNFCRLLTGAWVDWHDGIRLQNGDTVVHRQNVYRVVAPHGTTEYESHEPPVHARGAWADGKGLKFVHNRNDGIHQANIKDVTFSNIYLYDNRRGFLCGWESDAYHRAIHPSVEKKNLPVCNVVLENIHCFGTSPVFVCNSQANVVIDKINSNSCLASFSGRDVDCSLLLTAAYFNPLDKAPSYADIQVGGEVKMNIHLASILQRRDINLNIAKSSRTRLNGTASVSNVKNLTPVLGDSIKVNNVLKTYDGSNWK